VCCVLCARVSLCVSVRAAGRVCLCVNVHACVRAHARMWCTCVRVTRHSTLIDSNWFRFNFGDGHGANR